MIICQSAPACRTMCSLTTNKAACVHFVIKMIVNIRWFRSDKIWNIKFKFCICSHCRTLSNPHSLSYSVCRLVRSFSVLVFPCLKIECEKTGKLNAMHVLMLRVRTSKIRINMRFNRNAYGALCMYTVINKRTHPNTHTWENI